ncbi:MAG: hypothetical protein GWP08_04365 [Nitrospiraceae bacterium]|nr:hypothetical protein [Nitrospiraceae bacterium]
MHTRAFCLVLVLIALTQPVTADIAALEAEFRNPGEQSRKLLGPLFWLHGDESPERLQEYLAIVAEGGNGCFTAESRPHSDWLGEGWFRDLAVCLDSAKRLGLDMWIFDEKWWPSGEVGGKVPKQYASKSLQVKWVDVPGPGACSIDIPKEHLIAVIAGRLSGEKVEGGSLVDLTPQVADTTLAWNAPEGGWRVMVFTWDFQQAGHRYLVDGASQDAVDWYLDTVYQPHYDRFGAEFGKTIKGYFYDEPETHGDWGTEVIPMLDERGADWMQALVAFKCGLAGPEQEAAAKYQYIDAFAEAWGRTLFGGITEWCHDHGVESTGHFLEHVRTYAHPKKCAYNMVQLMKYTGMGGIDAVFTQFAPGKRDLNLLYTPKLGSSVTHAYGKRDDLTMVEIYGARGQDLSYPEMKWWLDVMQVQGVNFIIPHSFNPRAPYDRDCPPYFYNGGYEPRWPLYKVWADYSVRLSSMLVEGVHAAPVAFLYPGVSLHVGERRFPEKMTDALMGGLLDCDWLPYEVFEKDVALNGRNLALRREVYRVLLLPSVEVMPYETLAKTKAFFDQGGVVAGYGMLPTRSATPGKSSADMAELVRAVWGETPRPGTTAINVNPQGGRAYLLPSEPSSKDVREALVADAGILPALDVAEGATEDWLHILHRRKEGHDVFFVANLNSDEKTRPFKFRANVPGVPEVWDAIRNEITSIPFERRDKFAEFDLTLEPYESAFVVFNDRPRGLPPRMTQAMLAELDVLPVTPIALDPAPELVPEYETLDMQGAQWIWHPDDPVNAQLPGRRYFRKTLQVAKDLVSATLLVSADNRYTLHINDARIGGDAQWEQPKTYDVREALHTGENVMAVLARNGGEGPNPAGLVCLLRLAYENGDTAVVVSDGSWISATEAAADWKRVGVPQGDWKAAIEVAPYGGGPWGAVGQSLTLSPVKRAEPFEGHVDIPDGILGKGRRVFVAADTIDTEAAARVTINGAYAGGFIGAPLRLEISRFLKKGQNHLRIEPFAPQGVRLLVATEG